MMRFENVTHRYGNQPSVRGVSFEVGLGETVALLGPSGCGKTTLLRLAAGLEQAESGQILMEEAVVNSRDTLVATELRHVGLVFQDFALFPHLSVRQNIAFGLSGKADRTTRVDELLELTKVQSLSERYPHEISGGEQQRVALARALAPEPKVLLLDEPFSGLDARLREQIRQETREILDATKTATLLVTHDSEEAMGMADRIAVLRQGQMEQMGTAEEIYTKPKRPFVARFLGELNELEAHASAGSVQTPVGTFLTDSPDGPVVVAFRPSALRPVAESEGFVGRIQTRRFLRGDWACTIEVPVDPARKDSVGRSLRLSVRTRGVRFETPLTHWRVDPDQVHIFPAESALS